MDEQRSVTAQPLSDVAFVAKLIRPTDCLKAFDFRLYCTDMVDAFGMALAGLLTGAGERVASALASQSVHASGVGVRMYGTLYGGCDSSVDGHAGTFVVDAGIMCTQLSCANTLSTQAE